MKNVNLETYNDGRKPISELYASFLQLEKEGWVFEEICLSEGTWKGKTVSLPIISLRTKKKGKSIWILSGIHGEEPAGPNALSEGIKTVLELGKKTPVVLVPLCNPLGYLRNWRYLNHEKYSEDIIGKSVGDSDHLILNPKIPNKPLKDKSTSLEAEALTNHVLKLSKKYPPLISVDLHEDNMINEGYVYSQGKDSTNDSVAKEIVKTLAENGIPIKMNGKTRFGEDISEGIIGNQKDGSIDELVSSEKIYLNKKIINGPNAKTVIVVETPAAAMSLEKRKYAHLKILESLKKFI
jgi:hypothetical protein